MKCSHRSHDGFFSHGFSHVSRVFARFSHDLLFQFFFFFRTDFRTFRTVSHGFRTTCFFKVFCSHVSRVFARSSHTGRRPAFLCQIRSKICTNLEKITRFDWRTPTFLNFYKKKLDQLKMNTLECFGYLYS